MHYRLIIGFKIVNLKHLSRDFREHLLMFTGTTKSMGKMIYQGVGKTNVMVTDCFAGMRFIRNDKAIKIVLIADGKDKE